MERHETRLGIDGSGYGAARKKCTNEFLMSLPLESIYSTHTSLDLILTKLPF